MPTLPKPFYSLPAEKPAARSGPVAQIILFLLFAPFVIGLPYFVWTEFNSIKDDIWLPSHGVLARNPDAYNIHHANRYTNAHFCVSYETQQGQPHSKCTELFFPFLEADPNQPLVVHYDPAAPDHASTSWGLHRIVSRTFVFLVFLFICFFVEFLAVTVVIKKITGKDLFESKPEEELCEVLRNLVSTLKTQPHNADYAQSLAAGLVPLVERYKQAVTEASSTSEASRALAEIIVYIDSYRREKLKRHIEFGSTYTKNLRAYESLINKLRQANYGSDSL